MRAIGVAFPFVLAASLTGFHACQSVPAGTAHPGTDAKAAACGVTVLYQNNGDGEIEPCG